MKVLPPTSTLVKLTFIFFIVLQLLLAFVWFRSSADVTTAQVSTTAHRRKLFIAFSFNDQMTMATENLLILAALATYGDRNVVVPFVKDSKFYGTKLDNNTGTLSRYFDLEEFNRKLDSYGYGSLMSWKHFQKHCHERLDILLTFLYSKKTARDPTVSNSERQLLNRDGWSPCSGQHTVQRIEARLSICIDPEIFDSFEKLESEVLRGSPCVGIVNWKGVGKERTHFRLPSNIPSPFSIRHEVPLNRDLLQLAQEFVSKRLANDFISVHIRSEWVLRRAPNANMSKMFSCLQTLKARIQKMNLKETANVTKIFLATDFTKFGSSASAVKSARKESDRLEQLLDNILGHPETFDPSGADLSDRGSIAIVEMSILTAGKKLFLVGGGSFEDSIKFKFERVHNNVAVKICYRDREKNVSKQNGVPSLA